MIDVQTLTRLKAMRLSGMAEFFENLADTTGNNGTLTGPEMVKMAVDWEYERRRDSKLHRLRKHAGLAQSDADIADLKAMPGRTVDTELISRLAVGSYLQKHQDVILQGPTGAGKTYVACALGNKACQQYRTVLYLSAGELFDRITIAERTGDKKRCLDTLVRVELLIIDDWFLTTPTRTQVQQLHTLIDRRHKTASTIYCTQLPPGQWHDRMEEKILADAIVDRITTNAHATVLTCDDSMRKHFNQLEWPAQQGRATAGGPPTGAAAHSATEDRLTLTGTVAHHQTEQWLSPRAICSKQSRIALEKVGNCHPSPDRPTSSGHFLTSRNRLGRKRAELSWRPGSLRGDGIREACSEAVAAAGIAESAAAAGAGVTVAGGSCVLGRTPTSASPSRSDF